MKKIHVPKSGRDAIIIEKASDIKKGIEFISAMPTEMTYELRTS